MLHRDSDDAWRVVKLKSGGVEEVGSHSGNRLRYSESQA